MKRASPSTDSRAASARAFVRSLNILLKFARLYDFGHPRTKAQYETAWRELRAALDQGSEAGLLLAASGNQLLLDGVPLESAAAEKSFAKLLSTAGIASIHFSPSIAPANLARFVRAFPSGGATTKPTLLAEQLKAALEGDTTIHVNEFCYVQTDSSLAQGRLTAELTARSLGLDPEKCDALFKDPEKLLQLIIAAEGSRGRSSGSGNGPGGNGPGGNGPGGNGPGGNGEGSHGTGGSGGNGAGTPGSGPGGFAGGGSGIGTGGWGVGAPGSSGDSGVAPFGAGGDGSIGFSGGGSGSGNGGAGGIGIAGNGGPAGSGDLAGGFGVGGGVGAGGTGTGGTGTGGVGAGAVGAGGTGAGGGWAGGAGAGVGNSAATKGSNFAGQGPGAAGASAATPSRWTVPSAGLSGAAKQATSYAAPEPTPAAGSAVFLAEDDAKGIMRLLAQLARASRSPEEKFDADNFQWRLSSLSMTAQFSLRRALAGLASQAPKDQPDEPLLLKLAEHVAIRFALDSYERGEIRVNAVQDVLARMTREVESLHKILGTYEDKLSNAGIDVTPHAEVLALQFWQAVPDENKRAVLLSPEAWCVPARNIRDFVEKLFEKGENETAQEVLRNYVACVCLEDPKARRVAAGGLTELVKLYTRGEERLLVDAVRDVGLQLCRENDPELQSLVGAAFVRLSQQATEARVYPAVQRAVELVDFLQEDRPALGESLRPRIAVENRLPEFIEEAVRAESVPSGLTQFLRRIPQAAAEQLAGRFTRSGFREECDRIVEMVQQLGPEGVAHLRSALETGSATQAVETIGILSRLDLGAVEQLLPRRLSDWQRPVHDRVVRQLASSAAPERGRLLISAFDLLDPLVRSLALDEIGLSGDVTGVAQLLRLAEGDMPGASPYLRLKAVEALGRLRAPKAEMVLRRIVEARKIFGWAHPSELRIVAAQALERIDPDWARESLHRYGFNSAELALEPLDMDPNSPVIRQRRYFRIRLSRPVQATASGEKENCRLEVQELNLAGGIGVCEQHLHPGMVVSLRLNRSVRAQAFVRDARSQTRAFEVANMDLDERAKLRRLLVQLDGQPVTGSPESRKRKGSRLVTGATS